MLAIDVTNPEQVEQIGFLYESTVPLRLKLLADQGFVYAILGTECSYATCEENLLRITDATNPSQMVPVATMNIADEIWNMAKFGNMLVLIGDDLWLVDVSDPRQPQMIGQFQTPGYAQDAIIRDGLIYVADGAGGLLVLRLAE